MASEERPGAEAALSGGGPVTIALCGDVMTGRGIDQILPVPCDPRLHESYAASALDYVALAEQANGPIARRADLAYPWGDAPAERRRAHADAWIANLETGITRGETFEPKGINYRMSPENAATLKAAGIDCCTLANNHVLDWGRQGLTDTLARLRALGIAAAGAGENRAAAAAPAVVETPRGRILVFAFGLTTSGIPLSWEADDGPGVNLLADTSERTVADIARQVRAAKRPGDVVVASIHWGGNWGYEIEPGQRRFAHGLIEMAGVDIVFGHSSHHPKAIEVHRGRPILYGCGDFLNDYEGIAGYEMYRDDLTLLYLVTFDGRAGSLLRLEMVPFRIRRFSLARPAEQDAAWLAARLERECSRFGVSVARIGGGRFAARWPGPGGPDHRRI